MNTQGKQDSPATLDFGKGTMTQLSEAGMLALRSMGFVPVDDEDEGSSRQFSAWLADLNERRPDLAIKARVGKAFSQPDPVDALTSFLEELRDELNDDSG